MQAFAVAGRQFEDPIVSGQNKNVPCRVENGGADFAVLQMFLYQISCFRRQRVVEEFGDVVPDVFAFQYHENHLLFFGLVNFSLGASSFCSMIRARCSLTFTEEILMASVPAVSSMLSSSMSRITSTSR